jgi:hypothetical protein
MLGKRSRQKPFVLGLATVLLLIGIGGTWLTLGRSAASIQMIPSNIRTAVDFPLYYPEQLPKGYTINPSSFGATNEVVTYSINYGTDSKLAISLQPIPRTFDFTQFYANSMKDALSVNTTIGTAKIGNINGVQTVSLTNAKTWLLISAPNGIGNDALLSVLKSFRPVPSSE